MISPGVGFQRIATLGFRILGADANKVYYRSGAARLRSIDHDLTSNDALVFDLSTLTETGYSIDEGSINSFYITAGGSFLALILCPPDPSNSERYGLLFRSADSGSSWSLVLKCGNASSTHFQQRKALGIRNFADVTLAGPQAAVMYGEYATDSPDTHLTLHVSTDDGATWGNYWRLGNGAERHFRHIHGVYQAPDTDICVVTGDPGDEAAITKGPNSANWSAINNTEQDTIDGTAGYICKHGRQRYRGIGAAFHNGEVFVAADAGASGQEGDSGVWGFNAETLESERQIFGLPGVDGILGGGLIKLSGGEFVFSEYIQDADLTKINIWSSINPGRGFRKTLEFNLRSGYSNPTHFLDIFDLNGDLVVTGSASQWVPESNNWSAIFRPLGQGGGLRYAGP